MNLVDLAGWLGAGCLSICALPQAVKVWRTGDATGLSTLFVWLWFIGEIFTLVYVAIDKFSVPLIFNYVMNLTFCIVMLRYHYFPRKHYEEANKEN